MNKAKATKKENISADVFLGWTIVCLLIWLVVALSIINLLKYDFGDNITVSEFHTLEVETEANVPVVAAAGNFFAITGPNRGLIVGLEATPPPGWRGDYYLSDPESVITGGTWEVEKGRQVMISFDEDQANITKKLSWITWEVVMSITFAIFVLIWFKVLEFMDKEE